MGRRKSKLTDEDEGTLADEIIPWWRRRKSDRARVAAIWSIWAKSGGTALGGYLLIEAARWALHLGGGGGGGIP